MATLTRMCVLLGSAFGVEIDDDKHVGELIEAIKGKKKNAFKSADADKLHLFLAKRKEGEWLNGPGAAAVATDDLVQFTPMDSTLKIGNDKYFGSNFHPGEGQVHVLVRVLVAVSEHLRVHRNMARDENLPVAKRVKIAQVEVAYQGLVPNDFYSVPVETIATYQKLEMAFLSRSSFGRICLLYGPRQFGKKTIAHRLLALLAADPSILVIYCSLTPSIVETEEKFWLAFSSIVGETTKSLFEFETMFSRRKTRLWLAIDDMNTMLTNEKLSINSWTVCEGGNQVNTFWGFLELEATIY
ncbi:hypothetical protein P3T76_007488 [Phytophthora citrophthora]|uniref:Crinkler effector protein N-terminal domain-containing protein n=1 Tax=Phytophthora citrophthora TaxID=4793 RepID=A0AAD9GLR5_9STRA|nr:hypothetical protein P3T76_007488 [Phytophthora citrophthora]